MGVHWMMVHRVRELRADGYRTAILTNNVKEWGTYWKASIPLDLFDEIVDSCEVGLRKPDPAIYRLTCDRLKVTPEAAVFLDDTRRHVEGARRSACTPSSCATPGLPWPNSTPFSRQTAA